MTLRIRDLAPCFEGVIPALVATAAADGMPNVSYLSHVAMIDDVHIGLSNQFFSKTSANLRASPKATILLVDGYNGGQYMVQAEYAGSRSEGPQFDRLAAQVAASSVHVGLGDVMKLHCVDVFKVLEIVQVPAAGVLADAPQAPASSLSGAQRVVEAIMLHAEAGAVVDAALSGMARELGISHCLLFALDPENGQLSAIGSHGYPPGAIGADARLGEGVIGVAAQSRQTVKINELSRTSRFSAAVRSASRLGREENSRRSIALPGLPDALSQIAVPMLVHGVVQGVLFAESRERLAFTADDEAAMCIVARQAGVALALCEILALDDTDGTAPDMAGAAAGATIEVTYYPYDDSVFIDNNYVIKGIAGRLLHHMLEQFVEAGRQQFSNREIRLDASLRLPDVKSNLETRLLLLRRRLDDKAFPIRLVQRGRGLLGLECAGQVILNLGGN